MASSGNFAVFSIPLRPQSSNSTSDQITGGGLSIKGPSGGGFEPVIASISPSSGKWYWEYRAGQGGGSSYGRPAIAVSEQGIKKDGEFFGGASGQKGVLFVVNDGQKRINGSDTSYGNAVSQHDIVQMALDCDNGAMYFGINNTWQNSGNPASGASKTGAALTADIQNVAIDIIHTRYVGGGIDQYNFGQDDTFGGAISAAGNTDENSRGVFKYAPPTGFLALCSANLPISDDIDPAQTDDNIPTKQFNAVAYSGTGSTHNIDVGFKPDLIWTKIRVASDSRIVDSSRGYQKRLVSNNNNAEATDTSGVTAFTSTGYTLSTDQLYNGGSYTYVSWCWRAGGGTTSTNTQGDITSTVQASQSGGFSICTYAGTLGGSGTASVGHGLTAIPDFIISKSYDTGSKDWTVLHSGLTSRNYKLTLNTDAAEEDRSSAGDMSSLFTTTTFGTNATTGLNQSGRNYIAYVWHSVEGYSKFGTYVGNGNTDGPFIYTGFRPRMLFIKKTSSASWYILDTARGTHNPITSLLNWDTNNGESDIGSANNFDVLSNGLKIRTSGNGLNGSGGTFVYGAWSDVPFRYNNTF